MSESAASPLKGWKLSSMPLTAPFEVAVVIADQVAVAVDAEANLLAFEVGARGDRQAVAAGFGSSS